MKVSSFHFEPLVLNSKYKVTDSVGFSSVLGSYISLALTSIVTEFEVFEAVPIVVTYH